MPRAHISTLFPYLCPLAYSGAMKRTVPMTSLMLSCPWNTLEWTSAESPKSAIFAVYLSWGFAGYESSSKYFSSFKLFSGYMSLCIKFFLWIYCNPLQISWHIDAATSSSSTFVFSFSKGEDSVSLIGEGSEFKFVKPDSALRIFF